MTRRAPWSLACIVSLLVAAGAGADPSLPVDAGPEIRAGGSSDGSSQTWPDSFRLEDVSIEVQHSQGHCFGGGEWTLRLHGDGRVSYCWGLPALHREPGEGACRTREEWVIPRSTMIDHLEVLASLSFFALDPAAPEQVYLILGEDGVVVSTSDIVFSTSSWSYRTVEVRIGERSHRVDCHPGAPAGLVDWAQQVLDEAQGRAAEAVDR